MPPASSPGWNCGTDTISRGHRQRANTVRRGSVAPHAARVVRPARRPGHNGKVTFAERVRAVTTLRMQWTGDGIARITTALTALEGTKAHTALRRAINHTGAKCYTRTRRTLAKQIGLTQAWLDKGKLKKLSASGGALEYHIYTVGGAVRAKEFKHYVGKKGITFYPWGVAHNIRSAFVIKRYSSNFYRRRTRKRFPLEALYGPNISKELVKDATAAAFFAIVRSDLPTRVEHEVRVITNGVVS